MYGRSSKCKDAETNEGREVCRHVSGLFLRGPDPLALMESASPAEERCPVKSASCQL